MGKFLKVHALNIVGEGENKKYLVQDEIIINSSEICKVTKEIEVRDYVEKLDKDTQTKLDQAAIGEYPTIVTLADSYDAYLVCESIQYIGKLLSEEEEKFIELHKAEKGKVLYHRSEKYSVTEQIIIRKELIDAVYREKSSEITCVDGIQKQLDKFSIPAERVGKFATILQLSQELEGITDKDKRVLVIESMEYIDNFLRKNKK